MKNGLPTISIAVKATKATGGHPSMIIDNKRLMPPMKIMPQSTRKSTVCLSNRGDQPPQSEADADPDAGKESKVGVQQDNGWHARGNVDRILDAHHAEESGRLPE